MRWLMRYQSIWDCNSLWWWLSIWLWYQNDDQDILKWWWYQNDNVYWESHIMFILLYRCYNVFFMEHSCDDHGHLTLSLLISGLVHQTAAMRNFQNIFHLWVISPHFLSVHWSIGSPGGLKKIGRWTTQPYHGW